MLLPVLLLCHDITLANKHITPANNHVYECIIVASSRIADHHRHPLLRLLYVPVRRTTTVHVARLIIANCFVVLLCCCHTRVRTNCWTHPRRLPTLDSSLFARGVPVRVLVCNINNTPSNRRIKTHHQARKRQHMSHET